MVLRDFKIKFQLIKKSLLVKYIRFAVCAALPFISVQCKGTGHTKEQSIEKWFAKYKPLSTTDGRVVTEAVLVSV
jgi:hypothetical protein